MERRSQFEAAAIVLPVFLLVFFITIFMYYFKCKTGDRCNIGIAVVASQPELLFSVYSSVYLIQCYFKASQISNNNNNNIQNKMAG